ncbi:MAG: DUF3298 and DUF4163 domain-containing protein [Bacillota bacterium]
MSRDNVMAQINEQRVDLPCVDVVYPQVAGLSDKEVQSRINQMIEEQITDLLSEVDCADGWTATGRYSVEVNQNGILSIRLEVYTYKEQQAHGMTVVKSLTVDLASGKVYELRDLFKRNSHYILRLSNIIKEQIQERDLPLINEFNRISDNEEFYLTENALVIYFQLYEYTPYYVGIPEFVIPYDRIRNLIREDGPIGRILEDQ